MQFNILNNYQKDFLAKIKNLKPTHNFAEWNYIFSNFIERIIAIGWHNDGLFIITYDGYLNFNPKLCKFTEKKNLDNVFEYFAPNNLSFSFNGQVISVYGLFGGNGNCVTKDGWSIEVIAPFWPNSIVKINSPFKNENGDRVYNLLELKLIDYYDLKVGFSICNNFLVISNGNGFEIYGR
jgi:hypothetical protein